MLLAGDVGGTKVNIGLFDDSRQLAERPAPALVHKASYRSGDFAGLAEIVDDFLGQLGAGRPTAIAAACFGVAGPVVDDRTETTNLPWTLDGARLGSRFGVPSFSLVNDLVATAEGIAALRPDELRVLQAGRPPRAPATGALIAAGTGLGMCLLFPAHGRFAPRPSEGGHVDLAPRTEEQVQLWRFLRGELGGHVSIERVVSGPGLVGIYRFLRAQGGLDADAETAAAIAADALAAPRLISGSGLASRCPTCSRALGLFIELYGMAAANLALTALATGGLFVGGGIAPKILPRLEDGAFLAAFHDAGRFRELMEAVPVKVLLNQEAALLGASLRAARAARAP